MQMACYILLSASPTSWCDQHSAVPHLAIPQLLHSLCDSSLGHGKLLNLRINTLFRGKRKHGSDASDRC